MQTNTENSSMAAQMRARSNRALFNNIPEALKARRQWVCWRIEERDGRPTKVPYSASGGRAKSDSPETWTLFDDAVRQFERNLEMDGIGYMFAADDEYCGVDLDKCFDTSTGSFDEWALEIVEELGSYTEVSPSGRGFHVIVRAKLPKDGRRRKGAIEMYDSGRYFTMTGDHFADSARAIVNRQAVIEALYKRLFDAPKPSAALPERLPPGAVSLDDGALIDKALGAKNGADFSALWNGDYGQYGTHSEADFALCVHLAFWTAKNPERMDRLFRQSGLYRPKWDKKRGGRTYGEITIAKAAEFCSEAYSGPKENLYKIENGRQAESIQAATADVYQTDVDTSRALNDVGNASRFADQWRSRARYVSEYGHWIYYKGIRWHKDQTGEVWRMARKTASLIYQEAANAESSEHAEKVSRHAHKTQSSGGLNSMLMLARSETGLTATQSQLDRNPLLIGAVNGIINLKSGKLEGGKAEDYITKALSVGFDPAATCPVWENFLLEIMAGRADLVAYLQRIVGYALTGDVSEQCMFIFYGCGANGKSTFLDVIMELYGHDYAKQAAPDMLMSKGNDRHPTEVADLRGARLVASMETGQGRKLDENLVKQMTGGDIMKARFMRQDFFEFKPEFKLFMSTNHKPTIRGTDYAIWRRIHLIPFDVVFDKDKRDLGLPKKLRAELPGILAWAVRGCLEWQQRGLERPDSVAHATDQYRAEMDVLAAFLEECCTIQDWTKTTAKELYRSYVQWCDDNGERPEAQRSFGLRLAERGFRSRKGGKGARIWEGIGLLLEIERGSE